MNLGVTRGQFRVMGLGLDARSCFQISGVNAQSGVYGL